MTDITQSAVHTISADLVTEIRSSLESGKPVRQKFKDWGRLHIDRQLPFLCVYRRPVDHSDAGTKQLLLGEAAYILAATMKIKWWWRQRSNINVNVGVLYPGWWYPPCPDHWTLTADHLPPLQVGRQNAAQDHP